MAKRYITEMGMGTDVHGVNYTVAAERAVFDAIHHSSLHFFKHLSKSANDMVIDLMVAVPKPEQVACLENNFLSGLLVWKTQIMYSFHSNVNK